MKMGNYSNKILIGLLTIILLPIDIRHETELPPATHYELRRRFANLFVTVYLYADHQSWPQHMFGLSEADNFR